MSFGALARLTAETRNWEARCARATRSGSTSWTHDPLTASTWLCSGLVAHVAFVDDGQSYCLPILYARVGGQLFIHGCEGAG
jgi:Pyridoxamine 5'-phosphate oxidase